MARTYKSKRVTVLMVVFILSFSKGAGAAKRECTQRVRMSVVAWSNFILSKKVEVVRYEL